jgi:hypothetical protein
VRRGGHAKNCGQCAKHWYRPNPKVGHDLVQRQGFRIQCLGLSIGVYGLECRVQGLGCRV